MFDLFVEPKLPNGMKILAQIHARDRVDNPRFCILITAGCQCKCK